MHQTILAGRSHLRAVRREADAVDAAAATLQLHQLSERRKRLPEHNATIIPTRRQP